VTVVTVAVSDTAGSMGMRILGARANVNSPGCFA
jgi:hypothetical protein